jgi:hypothetical protein
MNEQRAVIQQMVDALDHADELLGGNDTLVMNGAAAGRWLLEQPAPVQEKNQSPYPEYDRGFSNGWDRGFAAAQPAPVQEPVAQVLSRDAVLANIAGWLRHLADDVTIPYFTNGAFKADCNEAADVLLATPPAAPVQEPWKPSDTANRIGGLPQDFIEHKVENEGDWSEWVNPDSEQYFMKCCDCGLVHEMQFKVVKYSEGDECEFIDDADLQAVFRARRATPPAAQKPWVGLSEEEVEAYDDWADFQVGCGRQTLFDMVRNIEAKLKEKNHD